MMTGCATRSAMPAESFPAELDHVVWLAGDLDQALFPASSQLQSSHVLATSIALSLGFSPALAQQPALTCETSHHRALDFWLGDWDAYLAGTETLVGHAQIRVEDLGCVITEYWTLANGARTGRSLNIYDRVTGRWEQFWADSAGDRTHYVGAVREGVLTMIAEDDVRPNAPTAQDLRITFSRLENGDVSQRGEASTDNGRTWVQEYDLIFRRRAVLPGTATDQSATSDK